MRPRLLGVLMLVGCATSAAPSPAPPPPAPPAPAPAPATPSASVAPDVPDLALPLPEDAGTSPTSGDLVIGRLVVVDRRGRLPRSARPVQELDPALATRVHALHGHGLGVVVDLLVWRTGHPTPDGGHDGSFVAAFAIDLRENPRVFPVRWQIEPGSDARSIALELHGLRMTDLRHGEGFSVSGRLEGDRFVVGR